MTLLPPIWWIVHASCTTWDRTTSKQRQHTIEMLVEARTVQEAQQVANAKCRKLDYNPWQIKAIPAPADKVKGLKPAEVPALALLPPPPPPKPKEPDVMDDPAFFGSALTRTQYARGIACDSLP